MSAQSCCSPPLRAAGAKVDITPRAGVPLAGAGTLYRPAEMVVDPLHARALVLESAGRRLCFLALDVLIVTQEYTVRIRQEAAERYGLEPDAVMVHATHTHSAPSMGHIMVDPDFPPLPPDMEWVRGGDLGYSAWACERALDAIGQAVEALQPVQMAVASGIEGRMAHNRRAVMRDGTVSMPGRRWPEPLGPTCIRYLEGPIDPELGVLCLRNDALQMVAVLVNYACHPVHVFPSTGVSSDWPGALCQELQRRHGAGCVPIVLNGACGNLNPWPPFDPDYVEDHRRMGRVLADGAQKVMQSMSFRGGAVLDWRVRCVPIPLREPEAAQLDWARGILEASPEPTWVDADRRQISADWLAAASIVSVDLMRRRGGTLEYEIQVLRVGEAAFVGLPGEPFVEGQLRIKLACPTYPTYVAHCTSQYVGYIPTREALARGGHEATTRYWAKLAPEALDIVVEQAVEVLNEVFAPAAM